METLPQLANSTAKSSLLADVSIDSDMNKRSSAIMIDHGDLDSLPRHNTDRSHAKETINMTYRSSTLPQPVGYRRNQVPPFMMQNSVTVAGPPGPVYSGPNQFVPVHTNTGIPPTAQQYGSYLMGHTPPQQMGAMPQQLRMAGFQQSPPQMYPGTVPSSMFSQRYRPRPKHILTTRARAQPYPVAMYLSPPETHYQPVQQFANTYTVHLRPSRSLWPISRRALFSHIVLI